MRSRVRSLAIAVTVIAAPLGFLEATDLMIKHCATYRAPRPGQVPPPDNCVTK